MIKLNCAVLLLIVVLSGCSTFKSAHDWVIDIQRPTPMKGQEKYITMFEEGRRTEFEGNIRKADDIYRQLVRQGNRYGEYGLAKLLSSWDDYEESVKYFLRCAKRSSYARSSYDSELFPDSAMDLAFSAAAMAELAKIAEHDRPDIADSLRRTMSDVVTPEVMAWAHAMKTNDVTEKIYMNVISAVESCRQSREYVKVKEWSEIRAVFINEDAPGGGSVVLPKSSYSVVRFVKVPSATIQYDFEVRLDGNNTFDADKRVEAAIRRHLVEEFLAENPYDSADDVRISRHYWNHSGATINGSVVAMKVSAVRLEYNDETGCGTIAVRLDGRNVSAAREWALKNIGELASGKNIVLVAGRPPPPGACYKALSERETDDGMLEIKFTTRPNNVE